MEKEKIDVRTQQLQMAQNMGLTREELEFLSGIEEREWKKRELYYICIIDGIPIEQLQKRQESGTGLDWIKKLRMDYWREKVAETGAFAPFGKDVESLKKEVKTVCRESHEMRQALELNVVRVLQHQEEVQREALDAKNIIIQIKENENENLSQEIAGLKETIKSLTQRLENPNKEKQWESVPSGPEAHSVMKSGISKKGTIRSILNSMKTKRFVQEFIKDEEFTDEQKDFLLDCLEEGMEISQLEKIAVPGVEIKMMERLKKLQLQRRE